MKLFVVSKIKNFFTSSHFRCDLLRNNYEDLPKNEILQRNDTYFIEGSNFIGGQKYFIWGLKYFSGGQILIGVKNTL